MLKLWKVWKAEIELLSEVLGTQPTNPKAREFLESRLEAALNVDDEEVPAAPILEEIIVGTFEVPRSTFFVHDEKPAIANYQLKGWFKSAAGTLPEGLGIQGRKGLPRPTTVKGYIDPWLFVNPRWNFFYRNGILIDKPDGVHRHYIQGRTPKGVRVLPLDSDYINAGARLQFEVRVVDSCPIDEDIILRWFAYAEQYGLLQWRSAGYGTFKLLSLVQLE